MYNALKDDEYLRPIVYKYDTHVFFSFYILGFLPKNLKIYKFLVSFVIYFGAIRVCWLVYSVVYLSKNNNYVFIGMTV